MNVKRTESSDAVGVRTWTAWMLLSLFGILAGCVAGESANAEGGAAWEIDSGTQESEVPNDSTVREFRLEDVAALQTKRRAFDGHEIPVILSIGVDDGPEDVLQDARGEVLAGTYIEMSFPQSDYPNPRRFYLGSRWERTQLRQRGYSSHWLNAWPDVHSEFFGFKQIWVYFTVTEDAMGASGTIPAHPLGDDLLRSIARVTGFVGNEETGIRRSFELRTMVADAWPPPPGRYVKVTCGVSTELDEEQRCGTSTH